jgi:hypothetical protein
LPIAEAFLRLRLAPRGIAQFWFFSGDFLKSFFDFAQLSGI